MASGTRKRKSMETGATEVSATWVVKSILDHDGEGASLRYKVKWDGYAAPTWKRAGTFACLPGVLEAYGHEGEGKGKEELQPEVKTATAEKIPNPSRYPHAKRKNCPIKTRLRQAWVRASLESVDAVPKSCIVYLDSRDCMATEELIEQKVPDTVPLIVIEFPDYAAVAAALRSRKIDHRVDLRHQWAAEYMRDAPKELVFGSVWLDLMATLAGNLQDKNPPIRAIRECFESGRLRAGSTFAVTLSTRKQTRSFPLRDMIGNAAMARGIGMTLQHEETYDRNNWFALYLITSVPAKRPVVIDLVSDDDTD